MTKITRNTILQIFYSAGAKKEKRHTACDKYEKTYGAPVQDKRDEKQKVNQMNLGTYYSLSSIANHSLQIDNDIQLGVITRNVTMKHTLAKKIYANLMVSRSSFLGKIPHGHIKLGAELTEDLHLFISVRKK
jgi:hypothetical protein